jgi:ubiquinone/menaquinone biosynthesis C-methylase UbiE
MRSMGMAESNSEIERLRDVYSSYETSELKQRQWSAGNAGNRRMKLERMELVREYLLSFAPLATRSCIDIGCGRGNIIEDLLQLGVERSRLVGIDLHTVRIKDAMQRFPGIGAAVANAEYLPYKTGSFEIVTMFTVLSSVLNYRMRTAICREIDRILKPGGALIVYDFRYDNPSNRNVTGIKANSITSLFPGYSRRLRTITLLPPLARRLGPLTGVMYPLLSLVPFLRTHYCGLLVKPRGPV